MCINHQNIRMGEDGLACSTVDGQGDKQTDKEINSSFYKNL